MDEWRSKEDCKPIVEKRKRGRPKRAVTEIPNDTQACTSALTSRGRSVAPPMANGKAGVKEIVMSEEEYDLLQHKLPNKNFEKVYFGEWEVKTW
jgi:histone acetyltransferase HTATIP/histone acetyltransferase MYST1